MDWEKAAFYDRPTRKARLLGLWDGSTPSLSPTEVGAEWRGEAVEIISKTPKRWVARSEKGSIFADVPSAFTPFS